MTCEGVTGGGGAGESEGDLKPNFSYRLLKMMSSI